MSNSSGAPKSDATENVANHEATPNANVDDLSLQDALERLSALDVHIEADPASIKSLGLNIFFRLTYPIWLHRLRGKGLCQDKSVLQAAKLLDEALKLAMLEDQKLVKVLAMAQINLALRHGVHAFVSRAVAYWGFFQIGGLFLAGPALRRAVQQATRLLSDNRFRAWQQPIISEWMGFLLPWTFPRRLTERRIEHLKHGVRDRLEFNLSNFGGEYELAANLFSTETVFGTGEGLRHLKKIVEQPEANEGHVADFGLAGYLAKLDPGSALNQVADSSPRSIEGVENGVESQMSIAFKLALTAVIAAVLRDYSSVVKTKAIIKSKTHGISWLATMPPVIFVLIVHASICEVASRPGINLRKWMKLLYELLLMVLTIGSSHSSFAWARHLILGELAASLGMTRFAYGRFRLSRVKAREAGYLLPLAVIQERLSIFSLSEGDQDLGRRQMKEARSLFAQWGSSLKLNQLDAQYSYLKMDREKKRVVGKMNGTGQKSTLSDHLNIRLISNHQKEKAPNFYLRDLIHLLSPEMGASPQAKESLTNRVNNYVEEIRRRSATGALLGISRQINENRVDKVPGLLIETNYAQAQELCGDVVFSSYDRINDLYYFGVSDNFARGPISAIDSLAISHAINAAISTVAQVNSETVDGRLELIVNAINHMALTRKLSSSEASLFALNIFVLEPQSGAGFYFNAANYPAYLRRSNRVMPLLGATKPLGSESIDVKSSIKPFQISPGDMVFVHTNGLVGRPLEAKNRVTRQEIRRSMLSALSPQQLASTLVTRLKALESAGLIDDAAYILVACTDLPPKA